MAKVTGVFTGMKGKVGNAVYAMWKGVQVLKTRVIPENPQSPDQTTNRDLFTILILMFKGIVTGLVAKFWDPFISQHQTGWANLIGVNQKLQAGTAIDYELVIVTKGSLPGEAILTATYDDATGAVVCTWADSGVEGSLPGDFAMVIAYDKVGNKWKFTDGTDTRGDATATCTLEAGLTITNVFIYLFFFLGDFSGPDITSVSNSAAQESIAPVP